MNKTQKPYTLETLPENIGFNQFYCYNTKNGNIIIGEILGKSAILAQNIYTINGEMYKTHDGFEGNTRTMTLNKKFKCFLDYQRFVNDYNKYLASKEKAKKARKTKYIVNKRTFYCRKTCAAYVPYSCKEFSTKADAEAFSYNGLQKLKIEIPKILKELRELKLILEFNISQAQKEYKDKFGVTLGPEYSELYKIQATPRTIKENDLLFRVNAKHYNSIIVEEVDDDFAVSVKGFVKPDIAKLSDGTILIENECTYSHPLMFQYAEKDKISIKVKHRNAKYLLNYVESDIKTLERAEKYVKTYIPFNTKTIMPYFELTYTKKTLKEIKDYLKTIE